MKLNLFITYLINTLKYIIKYVFRRLIFMKIGISPLYNFVPI